MSVATVAGVSECITTGAARSPAAIANLSFIATSMMHSPRRTARGLRPGAATFTSPRHPRGNGIDRAELVRRNRTGRRDLLHQVLVPLAFHLDVRGGAELDRLDQIVVDVGVDAGLTERVERRARRAAADEPGLEILLRRIVELAGFPDVVAVAADQMRTGIAVRLGMHDHHGLADLGRERILARQRAGPALEDDMGWNELAHDLRRVRIGFAQRLIG